MRGLVLTFARSRDAVPVRIDGIVPLVLMLAMDDLNLAIVSDLVCEVGIGKLESAREVLLRKVARAEVHIFIVVVLLIGLGIEPGIVDRQGGFARKRLIDMDLAVATDIGRVDTLCLGRGDLRVAGERHRAESVYSATQRVLSVEFPTIIIIVRRHIQILDSRALNGAGGIFRHRDTARHMHLIVFSHVFAGAIP